MFIDKLEKSDKTKTEVSNFISSILTSCIVMSIMFGQLGVGQCFKYQVSVIYRSAKLYTGYRVIYHSMVLNTG